MKVAVIDDSEVDRYIATRAVRAEFPRATIVEYADPTEALDPVVEAGKHDEPFLLLLDLNMPRVSGFDFLDQLRDRVASPPVLVLVLTSSAAQADRDAATRYGCVHGYIEKPLTRTHLRDLATSLAL